MKKLITPIITLLLFISIIVILMLSLAKNKQMVVVYEGNLNKQPIEIKLGFFQDSDCGMVIETIEYASQVIANNGKTWFFHDHGGMVNWLKDKSFKDKAKIYVYSKDTKRWIDGREAWYSLKDETPMGYGFGAYEKRKKGFIDFKTMSLKMLRGENMTNPLVKKRLLSNGNS